MKRIITACVLAAILIFSNVALAASQEPSPAPSSDRRIGLTLYMTDEAGNPMADDVVLVQKSVDAEQAYEGITDGRGAVAIPSFPLSSFMVALRGEGDTVTGIAEVSLYPGDKTEILNKPQSDNDVLSENDVQDTTFSRNIRGAGRVKFAKREMPVNRYEVQVSTSAEGLACLFEETEDNNLLLRGVGEGEAGEIAPEPTLPPDDEDRPETSSSASRRPSASPSSSASVNAESSPSEERTNEPSDEPSASESSSSEASPSPEELPSASQTTAQPTASPSPSATAQATQTAAPTTAAPTTQPPTPTPAPVPEPTSAPTTLENYVNIKLFLKDTAGQPLSYYVAVMNSIVQATCNEDGEAYFTNVPAEGTNQLVVRNTLGDQVGACGLRFVEGGETALSSVNTGSTYTIQYARGSQDVYVEIVVDVQQNQGAPDTIVVEEATAAPPTPAPTASPTPTPGPAESASAAPTPTPDEVIGTPPVQPGGPSVSGYFSNEAGIAIPGATIRLVNENTKNLSSSITNSDGAFGIGQLPPANYSLNAIDPQGRNLGTINFTVARGKRTQVKTGSDGKTYLTEGPNDSTVYMDLRELSNGTVDLMYASKSPLTAPAVLEAFTPPPSATYAAALMSEAPENLNAPIEEEVVDVTEIERPGQETEADAGTIVFVVVLCAMGVAVAAILLVRHARIR